MNDEDKPGCLGRMLCALGLSPRRREPEALPYHVRDDFLSSTELSFYHVLRTAVDERAVICPKLSLGDLFFTKSGDHRINTSYNNRIARKHVDFLLCDCQPWSHWSVSSSTIPATAAPRDIGGMTLWIEFSLQRDCPCTGSGRNSTTIHVTWHLHSNLC